MRLDLQVDQPHRVSRGEGRRGDQLEPQRFEAEEHLGIHQRAGVNDE